MRADTTQSGDIGVRRASASRLLARRKRTRVEDGDVGGFGGIDVMRTRHGSAKSRFTCRITTDGVEMECYEHYSLAAE